jgi:hypothetical protein
MRFLCNVLPPGVLVSVPIQLVQLIMLLPDGREQIIDTADGNGESSAVRGNHRTITLTELSLSTDTVRPGGVQCVAAVNGSLTPPSARMMIDSHDVTGQFVVTDQSRIIEESEIETEASSGGGRLGLHYGETKLTYSTSSPNATWNGRTLKCVASQESFPNVIATARIVVNCTYRFHSVHTSLYKYNKANLFKSCPSLKSFVY